MCQTLRAVALLLLATRLKVLLPPKVDAWSPEADRRRWTTLGQSRATVPLGKGGALHSIRVGRPVELIRECPFLEGPHRSRSLNYLHRALNMHLPVALLLRQQL